MKTKNTMLHLSIEMQQKNNYVRASYPGKLSDWIKSTLDDEVARLKAQVVNSP